MGTYGVGSAHYWWSRLSGSGLRLLHYIMGRSFSLEVLLYVDDWLFIVRGSRCSFTVVFAIAFLKMLGYPFSLKKFHGGMQLDYIGYYLDCATFAVGISFRRAVWVQGFVQNLDENKGTLMSDFASFLGRLSFACQLLHFLKPFLGPLYAWSAAGSGFGYAPLPLMIILTLRYIAEKVVRFHALPVAPLASKPKREKFRTDAKAEGQVVCVGGWETSKGEDTQKARWFSVPLDRENAPWAFSKGKPFKVIAALELFATFVGYIIFKDTDTEADSVVTLSAGTDNKSNGFALDKLMSTKYPLGLVLMEFSEALSVRKDALQLNWRPREENQPADDLTNSDFSKFDPTLRIPVTVTKEAINDYKFAVLPQMMEAAEKLHDQIQQTKLKTGMVKAQAAKKGIKKARLKAFRERNRW